MVFVSNKILKNYYDILGLSPSATKDQIKSAYRKLSLKFHPDKNNGEEFFESMFKSINEAHEVLSDERKRVDYDFRLKTFKDRTGNDIDQADVRRREEEVRRKQEELHRREQEFRQKESARQTDSAASVQSEETDWGSVINYVLVLNFFLILLIVVTPHKDKRTLAAETVPTKAKKTAQVIDPLMTEKSDTKKPAKIDYQRRDKTDKTDTVNDVQVELPESLTASSVETEIVSSEPQVEKDTGQTGAVEEKPKWFQFKKKRQLKKKAREEN